MNKKTIYIHNAYSSFNTEARKGLKSDNNFGDDLNYTLRKIFKELQKRNKLIFSLDPFPNMPPGSVLVYLDLPRIENNKNYFIKYLSKFYKSDIKIKLWLLEAFSVRPNQYNFLESCHNLFESIMTWSYDILNKYSNSQYVHFPTIKFRNNIRESSNLEEKINKELITKNISISFVGSNKSSLYPFNGNHLRIGILSEINKFTNNIYIYGNGWSKAHILPFRPNSIRRIIKVFCPKISNIGHIMGISDNKTKSIKSHHYSLCLENEIGAEGYLTEKIFDVLNQLRIPIIFKVDKSFPPELRNYIIEISKFSSIKMLINYLEEIYSSGEYFKKIDSLYYEIQNSNFQEQIEDTCLEAILK